MRLFLQSIALAALLTSCGEAEPPIIRTFDDEKVESGQYSSEDHDLSQGGREAVYAGDDSDDDQDRPIIKDGGTVASRHEDVCRDLALASKNLKNIAEVHTVNRENMTEPVKRDLENSTGQARASIIDAQHAVGCQTTS